MGDPRKTRRKYEGPKHPWKKARIEEESELVKKYAPKNKKEIWKVSSKLKEFKHQAKKLSSLNTSQAEKETKQLLTRLHSMGLLKEGDNLASILVLTLENMMERRLQTVVCRKSLARSMKQSRQFITHGHIKVGENVITSPSYLVLAKEEPLIIFQESSSLNKPEHPERQIAKPVAVAAKPGDVKEVGKDTRPRVYKGGDRRDRKPRRKSEQK
jgi:small subunit ribosomal protein S4